MREIVHHHRRRHRQPQARLAILRSLINRVLPAVARIADDFLVSHLVSQTKGKTNILVF